ncbi:hypothetical protein KR093_003632, partial [Drosophila rubida]
MNTTMATEALDSKVPSWLQPEIFTGVLQESVKCFSKIKNFKAESGLAAGENYTAIMLRVNIQVELEDGSEKSVSYMLKLPHQSEIYRQMLEAHNIFDAERTIYNTIIPEMEQMYRDVDVEVKFGPKSYDLKDAKSDYVLLEDLAPRGFKNMNRLEGLDQAHTESALRKLSQWHAASAVRVANKGSYPDKYTIGFYREDVRPLMTEVNNNIINSFLKSCETYEDNEEYIEQVKSAEPKIIDMMYKLAKPDTNGFNVLNHGDFWSNNMMFSHDSFGKIKETYMIDFPLLKYGSVAQDLYYFLISSTKLEDKLSKFDYYIKFYHDNLVENLKLLKYSKPVPTLRDIHIIMFKYGFWGYLTATGVMSGVLLDPTESASFDNLLSDSDEAANFKSMLYTNSRYRKHMKIVLPWLLNRGAFE